MIPASVEKLLTTRSDDALQAMLNDEGAVFWVDRRVEDDEIVKDCEGILRTGDLAAEIVEIDEEPHFELYISYRGRRVKVPLVIGHEDREITIDTLNQVLRPDYEIRICRASDGTDSFALLPLSAADWATLDARFGDSVGRFFRKVEEGPGQGFFARILGWLGLER